MVVFKDICIGLDAFYLAHNEILDWIELEVG